MSEALIVFALCYLSLIGGYVAGRLHKRDALDAYKAGVEDAHRRMLETTQATGGPCWVRGQVPPNAQG